MNGFIHQLISENIYFSLNYDRNSPENSSVILTANNEAQWDYFYYHIYTGEGLLETDKKILEIKMEDISDFPQITWSGLIPPTK